MFYYDMEHGVYITEKELKEDFDFFKATDTDETLREIDFPRYLELCHVRNNGILITALERFLECRTWLRFYTCQLKADLAECATEEEKRIVFEYGRDELETYVVMLVEARAFL